MGTQLRLKGAQSPSFRSVSIVAKRLHIPATAEHLYKAFNSIFGRPTVGRGSSEEAMYSCLKVNVYLDASIAARCKNLAIFRRLQFLQRAAMLALQALYYGNSVRPSVCPSVCHTPVLCQNDGTYHGAVCTVI